MIKKRKAHTQLFVFMDAFSAGLAWSIFFAYRKQIIESYKFGYKIPIELDTNFFYALVLIPIYWISLYYLAGHYKDVWRKSRINEISKTFGITVIGVVLLFFILLLDDEVSSYQSYYSSILVLFVLNFGLTLFFRLLEATIIKSYIKSGKLGFKTVVVGNNQKSITVVEELMNPLSMQGNLFVGYVREINDNGTHVLQNLMPDLGSYTDLPVLIRKYDIEEVILGIESSRHNEINEVSNILENQKVVIKIIPDLYDLMSGQVRINNVIGTALIEINHDFMPEWQKILKRMIDVLVSVFVLVSFFPLFLFVAIIVRLGSNGPVFYKQERIGLKGKPFNIFKFRTMIVDSEAAGPQLSKENDNRITRVGKWLRKYRIDELPQFYNVLIGEMSLVGPRPERKFFIDQIVKIAPHYKHLLRVKPGITSWGQVKYGYAENVEQMVDRLKFDILYIENRSLAVDFRILIYTVLTVLQGSGR